MCQMLPGRQQFAISLVFLFECTLWDKDVKAFMICCPTLIKNITGSRYFSLIYLVDNISIFFISFINVMIYFVIIAKTLLCRKPTHKYIIGILFFSVSLS